MKVNTTRIKLEDIYMDAVVKEDYEHTAETTDKPVEKGQDISDHYKIKPIRVDISGMIVNDSEEKYETLKGYMKDAKLLKYIGLTSVKNMVIVNVTRKSSSEVKDGYYYDLALKEVRIAVPETFEVKVKNPVTKKQDRKTASKVKAHSNKGRKQLKSTFHTAGDGRGGAMPMYVNELPTHIIGPAYQELKPMPSGTTDAPPKAQSMGELYDQFMNDPSRFGIKRKGGN